MLCRENSCCWIQAWTPHLRFLASQRSKLGFATSMQPEKSSFWPLQCFARVASAPFIIPFGTLGGARQHHQMQLYAPSQSNTSGGFCRSPSSSWSWHGQAASQHGLLPSGFAGLLMPGDPGASLSSPGNRLYPRTVSTPSPEKLLGSHRRGSGARVDLLSSAGCDTTP